MKAAADGLKEIFARIGAVKNSPPDDPAVQAEIEGLREYITVRFFACTPEILSGLGKMYSADSEFKRNIDGYGGEGVADFVSEAIEIFTFQSKAKKSNA